METRMDERKLGSFTIKMRVTELREYLIEAHDAEEAALKADSGEVFNEDYAHCLTLDWDVCELSRTSDKE
jgi:hypothetical protein